MRNSRWLLPACLVVAGACGDVPQPTTPGTRPGPLTVEPLDHRGSPERYVAIGTSISMGWASNGVHEQTQRTSWPALLSFGTGTPFTIPFIESPGCTSPLVAPLGEFKRLSGESAAGSTVCAPNAAGVTLPAQNVGIAGAIAAHALLAKPEAVGAAAPWYGRVLPTGHTQLTAALSQNPTFVSVELGGNEVLNGSSGLVLDGVTMIPLANFIAPYTAILNAIGADASRKALLLGLPRDLRNIPMVRRGDEIWAERDAFAALNVAVHANCNASVNYINVSLKTLSVIAAAAASTTPVTYSCADVGGIDYVLTPADVITLNQRMADMDAFIRQQAEARGYAYASLGALYDRPIIKGRYRVMNQLTSDHPYGAFISADGVHPGPVGHALLAMAAARAISQTYGGVSVRATAEANALVAAPAPADVPRSFSLKAARQAAAGLRGKRLPTCPMPGECRIGVPDLR